MKLYVCWGTFPFPGVRRGNSWGPGGHPCKVAGDALEDAGYSPEVVRCYGLGPLPDVTPGRQHVKRLTGQSWVPVLVTDDGQIIQDSRRIAEWARANPAEDAAFG